MMPLRAALATAKREGLIRHNPAQGLALPPASRSFPMGTRSRSSAASSSRPFWRLRRSATSLLLELLATSGLRISEAIALQRLHLQLDAHEPEVCIRRATVRGRIEPPKSKYGRREVRLSASLTAKLRIHLAAQSDQDSTALALP